MSGLAHFFRNQLPNNKQGGCYEASLLQQHDEEEESSSKIQVVERQEDSARRFESQDFDICNKLPKQTDQPLDYRAWKHLSLEYFLEFMEKRIADDTDERESEHDGDDDDIKITDHDGNDQEDSQHLESQAAEGVAEQQPLKQQQRHSAPKNRRFEHGRIPHHLHDTIHPMAFLADMDLYTSEITRIGLCRASPYWRLRDTRRPAKVQRPKQQPPRQYAIYDSSCLTRLEPCGGDEDGPLAAVYARVVCLEVVQLDGLSALRRQAERVHLATAGTAPRHKRRTKVYLYNEYAVAMDRLLRKKGTNRVVYMSFRHVPAKCILPWSFTDWVERHGWNEYCICIGDTSSMRVKIDDDDTVGKRKQHFRFDNPSLEIRVGWKDDETFHEFALHVEDANVRVDAVSDPLDSLHTDYLRCYLQSPEDFQVDTQGNGNKKKARPGTNATQSRRHADAGTAATNTERTKHEDQQPSTGANASLSTPTRELTHPERPINSADRRVRVVVYDRLNDLPCKLETHSKLGVEGGCIVSVFATVLGFRSPSRTIRGDQMVSIQLVDESIPLENGDADGSDRPVHTVQLNLFAKRLEDLPSLCYAGDVLRMHRVKAQLYNGELQLLGVQASSYVVFRRDMAKLGGPWITLPTAHEEYHQTIEDTERLVELWTWSQQRMLEHPTMKNEYAFTVEEVKRQGDETKTLFHGEAESGDLTVMVTCVIPSPQQLNHNIKGVVPCGYLRVWDGTGGPGNDPLPPDIIDPAIKAMCQQEPSNAVLAKIEKIVEKHRAVHPASKLQPPESTTGRVVNMAIWEKGHWALVEAAITAGSFIRLRNIQDSVLHDFSFRCLMVYSKSFLTPLPDLTYEVVRLIDLHGRRLDRGDALNPRSGVLRSRPVNFETLLTSSFESVFTGSLRIIDTLPPLDHLNMSNVTGILLSSDASGNASFRLAIRIEDGSSRFIFAILSETAANSFVGMSASNALADGARFLSRLRTVTDDRTIWEGTVQSTIIEERKFFIVRTLILQQ